MTQQEFENLTWEEKKQIEHSGVCFCGGAIRTFTNGEDSWSTECVSCGYLYDAD